MNKKPKPPMPRFSFKGLLLYILPVPLGLKMCLSIALLSPFKAIVAGVAVFFFYSAAHMNRRSLHFLSLSEDERQEYEYYDNRLMSLCYIGIGIALIMMFLLRRPLPLTLFMSCCGMLGFYLTYGIGSSALNDGNTSADDNEPQSSSNADSSERLNTQDIPDAIKEAIASAYDDLDAISALQKQLPLRPDHQHISKSIDTIIEQSHDILKLLCRSPDDASQARRFLSVYVHRIKEILRRYIAIVHYPNCETFTQRLIDVLDETQKVFQQQQTTLLENDTSALDIQLEVLDEQLKNERS